MFINKLEKLSQIMNKDIIIRLKKYFGSELNTNENNNLILLFQIYLAFERGNTDKKNNIIKELDNILN